ncbi:MAG: hypothetical protein GKR89_10115 [Candidatus Latescibacteria bacterium]|nr:hypothetical protein [Candidatus Latescibacterota bacterium]
MPEITLAEAQEIHRRILVFDGHNDTPVERVARGERPFRWLQRDEALHMDVPRMREGGFDGGFFIVGNGPTAPVMTTIERTLAQIEAAPEVLQRVVSSAQVWRAKATGRIGVLLAIEGAGRWLDGELDRVPLFYRLGVRCLGITHGEGGDDKGLLQGSPSPFGPCTPAERESERRQAKGLTDFGCDVLQLSNDMGLVTDLAHINDRAFYEVLERSSLPVTMTHTAAAGLCPHWRGMTDDQIRALAQADGVMGIAFAPFFIHPEEATIEGLVDHICYIADLVGIEHVAIGSDYDGLGNTPAVVPSVAQLPLLTHAMLQRGLSEAEVAQVWGGNFMRLLQRTID